MKFIKSVFLCSLLIQGEHRRLLRHALREYQGRQLKVRRHDALASSLCLVDQGHIFDLTANKRVEPDKIAAIKVAVPADNLWKEPVIRMGSGFLSNDDSDFINTELLGRPWYAGYNRDSDPLVENIYRDPHGLTVVQLNTQPTPLELEIVSPAMSLFATPYPPSALGAFLAG